MKKYFIIMAALLFGACRTIPQGAVAVTPFDSNRYLGRWYEIARFDFRFERNLNNTAALYSLKDDGNIKVVNSGYNYIENKWQEAAGKAKFRGSQNEASLKVSFFGPFYGSYNVIALDSEYKYALVAGNNLKYLWILSREKTIPESVKEDYLNRARKLGYDVSKLIWVEHNK